MVAILALQVAPGYVAPDGPPKYPSCADEVMGWLDVLSILKRVSLRTGTYRVARRFERAVLRRWRLKALQTEVALYRRILPPNSLCFDVGANTGSRSEALLNAGMRVVAFEPQVSCIPEIRARCAAGENLRIVPAAIGSAPAIATLFVRSSNPLSGLVANWDGITIGSTDVPVLTLDVAIEHFGHPYYCKIDVEGYELEVLRGLTRSVPVISIEYHLTPQDLAKTRSCAQRLRDLGMRFVNVCPAESHDMKFSAWRPLQDFESWFPGELDGNGAFTYGDLFFVDREIENRPPFASSM